MTDFPSFLRAGAFYEKTQRVNTLPFRSYYIPFAQTQEFGFCHGILDKRLSSEYVDLNGTWSFKAHQSVFDLENLDEVLPDEVPVPCAVQMLGYDQIQYLNHRYPFPFNPPYVPKRNPAFHYRRRFDHHHEGRTYLCFNGVDSAFYVFINGQFVGYSQISHSLSEFDITDFVKAGENVLDVIVLKWNASSYLEDQDKFRFSGIFRDVYLLLRPEKHLWDFKVSPRFRNGEWSIAVHNLSNVTIQASFKNKIIEVLQGKSIEFPVQNPHLWSVEDPYLYDAVLSYGGEKILVRVGLIRASVEEGVFKLNGKHRKLYGVNRHEFHPQRGCAITVEDTLKDLQLIKKYGVNAIRTSHYPDMPEFYDLCDVLGIYVLDEADVESHGAAAPHDDDYDLKAWQDFANCGLYDGAVLDRETSLYERDKNHSCVIMWSLGNESSYGTMFYAGADYIKAHDPRPIHYEGIWNLVDRDDYYTDRLDVVSRMYPEVDWLRHGYLDDPKEKRPLVLCEYSHAMGNSNGDLADYWKVIRSNDRFIGAFVWEWNDHAVDVDGKLRYGGDSGEPKHDGNFCVDGLVSPYREEKTNVLEMEAVYKGKTRPSPLIRRSHDLPCLSQRSPIRVDFDDATGGINQIVVRGEKMLVHPFRWNFFRAFIDNDMFDRDALREAMDAPLKATLVRAKAEERTYELQKGDSLTLEVTYRLYDDALDIKISYHKRRGFHSIHRVGLEFAIDASFQQFRFFGYGPDESYIDKRMHTKVDEYLLTANENYRHYLKPQESGSHYGTSDFCVGPISVCAKKPFSFNVIPYSKEQLMSAKHDYDLPTPDATYVSVDVALAGVGTHSCGPELLPKYRVKDHGENTFRFVFAKGSQE